MPCQCPQCTDTPGETYTERHRIECEARHVCKIETREGRANYLEKIEEKRGFAAMVELRNEVKRQWDLLKNDSGSKKSA